MNVEVVHETDETLRARRAQWVARLDIPVSELRRRVEVHEASYDEREIWSVIDECNYLLGEDGGDAA
jgi:hypothetical protein